MLKITIDDLEILGEPNSEGILGLIIDDIEIEISNQTTKISSQKRTTSFPSINISETKGSLKKQQSKESLLQKTINGHKRICCVHNGRYYCITNGCANTPCGTICD